MKQQTSRLRRVVRVVLLGLVGLVGLVTVGVLLIALGLRSDWGREQVRRRAEAAVNQKLAGGGQLALGPIEKLWLTGLRVGPTRLTAPAAGGGRQRLVALRGLQVKLRPLAALRSFISRRHLPVDLVAVSGLALDLERGADALWNLQRVLPASETKPEPAKKDEPRQLGISLEQLRLDGRARLILGPGQAPVEIAPIELSASARLARGGGEQAQLTLKAAGARLDVKGERRGTQEVEAGLTLVVPGALAAQLGDLAGQKGARGLTLEARVNGRLDHRLFARLGLVPERDPDGKVALIATVYPKSRSGKARLNVTRFDPRSLLSGLPAGHLTLEAEAEGQQGAAGKPQGNLTLTVRPSRVAGIEITGGEVALQAKGDRVVVERADLRVPAGTAHLSGHGGLTPDAPVALSLKADVYRADKLPSRPSGLEGELHLKAEVRGTRKHPRLDVRGTAYALEVAQLAAGVLDLEAHVEGSPAAPSGTVTLDARGLKLAPGQPKHRRVTLRVALQKRDLDLAARVVDRHGRQSSVELAGAVDVAARRADLHKLRLALPGYGLGLVHPTRVALVGPRKSPRLEVGDLLLQRLERGRGRDRLRVSADLDLDRHRGGRARLELGDLEVGQLVRALESVELIKSPGQVRGRASLALSYERARTGARTVSGQVRARLQGIVVGQNVVPDASAEVRLLPRRIALSARSSGRVTLSAEGELPLDVTRLLDGAPLLGGRRGALREAPLNLRVQLPTQSVERLLALAPAARKTAATVQGKDPATTPPPPRATGKVGLDLRLSGQWPHPVVDAEVALDQLTTQGLYPITARATVHYAEADGVAVAAKVSQKIAQKDRQVLTGSAAWRVSLANALQKRGRPGPWLESVASAPFTVRLQASNLTLDQLPPELRAKLQGPPTARPAPGAGPPNLERADVLLEASGSLARPEAKLAVTAKGVSVQKLRQLDLKLDARLASAEKPHLEASASVDWQGKRLADATVKLELPPELLRAPARGRKEKATALAWLTELRRRPALQKQMVLAARLDVPDLELKRAAALSPPLEQAHGRVKLALTATGTVGAPELNAQLVAREVGPADASKPKPGMPPTVAMPRTDLDARVTLRGRQLLLDVRGQQNGRTPLVLRATIDELDLTRPKMARIDARLTAQNLGLEPVGMVVPEQAQVSGQLQAQIEVKGTVGKPVANGQVHLSGGQIAVAATGQTYKDVKLDLDLNPTRLALRKLSVEAGGGHLEAQGEVELKDLQPTRFRLDVDARKFAAVANGEISAFLDAALKLRGTMGGARLQGEVTVDRALVQIPEEKRKNLQKLGPMDDVVIVGPTTDKEKQEKAKAKQAFAARVQIKIPRHFRIRGKDLTAELKADLLAKLDGPEVSVEGRAELIRGRVIVLGKEFRVEQANVNFVGGDPTNPFLDVIANHQVGDYTVKVVIGGSAKKPTIELQSDPSVGDQSAILGLLLTGSPDSKTSDDRSLGQKAGALVAGFAAGKLKDQVAKVVPIDVIKVDPGKEGEAAGLTSSRVEVGTYLTDDIYVSYAHRFSAEPDENANEATVEYRFKPRWSVESRYGDAGAGGVDVFWTYRY